MRIIELNNDLKHPHIGSFFLTDQSDFVQSVGSGSGPCCWSQHIQHSTEAELSAPVGVSTESGA